MTYGALRYALIEVIPSESLFQDDIQASWVYGRHLRIFVIANESQTLQNYADFRALKYRIGAGRSGRRLYSAEEFSKRQREVHEMYLCCVSIATLSETIPISTVAQAFG